MLAVIGTDGTSPLYRPDAPWAIWSMDEIFLGEKGADKNVPKVKDYVIEPESGGVYIVKSLSTETWIPELDPLTGNLFDGDHSRQKLFQVSVNSFPAIFRAYVDKKAYPHTCVIDTMCIIPGAMCTHAVLYQGPDDAIWGDPISGIYNSRGERVTHQIPLEIVREDSHEVATMKIVPSFQTKHDLQDGDPVTLVAYNSSGNVCRHQELIVETTTAIPDIYRAINYIDSVRLDSPFIDKTDPTTILRPRNVPVNELGIVCYVKYSDETEKRVPIDGSKVRLLGIDAVHDDSPVTENPLIVSYKLSPTELSVVTEGEVDSRHVSTKYLLKTQDVDGQYTIQLYTYPEWDAFSGQYRLRAFMIDLTGNQIIDVTGFIEYASGTTGFTQVKNEVQELMVELPLRRLSNSYRDVKHIESKIVTLNGIPSALNDGLWTVKDDTTDLTYGSGIEATINEDRKTLNLSVGSESLTSWLTKVYVNSNPLANIDEEIIEPTGFNVVHKNDRISVDIGDWDSPIIMPNELGVYSTIYLEFFSNVDNVDKMLSIAPMFIR